MSSHLLLTLGTEPRVLHMLEKCSVIEPSPAPSRCTFYLVYTVIIFHYHIYYTTMNKLSIALLDFNAGCLYLIMKLIMR